MRSKGEAREKQGPSYGFGELHALPHVLATAVLTAQNSTYSLTDIMMRLYITGGYGLTKWYDDTRMSKEAKLAINDGLRITYILQINGIGKKYKK